MDMEVVREDPIPTWIQIFCKDQLRRSKSVVSSCLQEDPSLASPRLTRRDTNSQESAKSNFHFSSFLPEIQTVTKGRKLNNSTNSLHKKVLTKMLVQYMSQSEGGATTFSICSARYIYTQHKTGHVKIIVQRKIYCVVNHFFFVSRLAAMYDAFSLLFYVQLCLSGILK